MAVTIDGSASVTTNDGVVLGITRGTAVASTSGTSIDFTGIPSWAKRITVMFSGVSTNGTSSPLIQLGDAGGIETAGYLGSSAQMIAASTTVLLSTAGMLVAAGVAATVVFHGKMVIDKIDGNAWVSSCVVSRSDAGAVWASASSKTLSDTLTQVRITTVLGVDTFDAGSVNIMYEG
jgi:hypothetical protein